MKKKTVLIIDDEPAISELLSILLNSHGYMTKIASTGRQGIDSISPDIDAIILDLLLPDIDGSKICQELKSNIHTKNIPIIVISGQQSKANRIESFYLGAEDYIAKPFEPDDLFARLDVVLRRHNAEAIQETTQHHETIIELHRIVDEESINVRFQPIYYLNPVRLLGFEMLSRPQTQTPLYNPEVFFKAALKYGVYYEVEMIGWRKALKTAAENFNGGQTLFLNCDPYLVEGERFNNVKKVLTGYGMPSSEIFLEITERSAAIAFELFYSRLREYRQDGFKIAVDDMGSGYSSLEAIIEIKPEVIKLDRHIVSGLAKDMYKNSIIKLFVNFCRENNIICVAEGIETKNDFEALLELGVEAGQGYYLSQPTDAIDVLTKPGFHY